MTNAGLMFNTVAAIVVAFPLIFARSNGWFTIRTDKVAEDEAAAAYGANRALKRALLLSRDCALAAIPLLILGTLLLLLGT